MTTTDTHEEDPDDAQTQAFREAPIDEWDERAVVELDELGLDDVEPEPLASPEQYETDDWDAETAGPKTQQQARDNLAARIADPACPDSEAEAGAYDTEET